MNYQEAVEWLKSYRENKDKVIYLRNRMTGIKTISYGEHSGQHKSLNDLMDEMNEIQEKMREVEDVIDNIENSKCRLVLGYRYLMFMTYEEIAEKMHYSVIQIKRFHKKGIKMILNDTK